MSDHYEVLGIGRGASKKEIKKKFYELAKQYHPDVNDDPGAEAKFKRINEAYAVLTSDRDRHEYDYNVNYTTSSTVRPKYNYDGSPFYNFDVWYTMHYGSEVAERMRLMSMNREKATSRQRHVSPSSLPSSSQSTIKKRGWSEFDKAMEKLKSKRRYHTMVTKQNASLCRVMLKGLRLI